MGYIVKLLDSGKFFIPGEDDIETTENRNEAIMIGQFEDYDQAKETAETWSGQMILNIDYAIEAV